MLAIGDPQVGDSDDTGRQDVMWILYNKVSLNLPQKFFVVTFIQLPVQI